MIGYASTLPKRKNRYATVLLSSLLLGFLVGLQHAIQADHVAAVASIAAEKKSSRSIIRHGVAWGLGHTVTLFLIGGACLLLASTIPDTIASLLELVVGVMLVLLGGSLIYRLWRDRVHFHAHKHEGELPHFHAHSHRGEATTHATSRHDHWHPRNIPWRTFSIGLVHGVAGSAALVVLTASTLESPWWGMLYILIFGIGSVVGMAVLSAVIAIPLSRSADRLTMVNQSLQMAIGFATCGLGGYIVVQRFPSAMALF
ncbi:MAG: sulfite exporter TauE/SafE family protein [Azonexus sp.]|jgi:cytochrome c biogenesis protein CcdA|nr:sulfite exporter TauE/SafE family protein [Azonexus sp.]